MLPCAYRCDVPTRSLWTNLGAENGNNVTQRPLKQEMTPLLCSPEMTFLMSCSFARGAMTHLLSSRAEEHNDFIRRVVPVRGRRRGEGQEARHPGSQSQVLNNEKWLLGNSLARVCLFKDSEERGRRKDFCWPPHRNGPFKSRTQH